MTRLIDSDALEARLEEIKDTFLSREDYEDLLDEVKHADTATCPEPLAEALE